MRIADEGLVSSSQFQHAKAAAARSWFGYGRWSAPYWFVGMEQGGDAQEELSYLAWKKLDGGELLDCREHHQAIDHPSFRRWHRVDKPATQSTWRSLIRLLLAYSRQPSSIDDVRAYQRDRWGSATGETAVVELTALRAHNLGVQIDRLSHREQRIATLRTRLDAHRPVFVVCYGTGCKPDYERLIETSFDRAGFAQRGDTLVVLTKHPTSRGNGGEADWLSLGQAIRERIAGRADHSQ